MRSAEFTTVHVHVQPVTRVAADCANRYPLSAGNVPPNDPFEAEVYPLEIVENHMIAHLPGGLALIDTGSPFSLGTGRPLVLLGKTREAKTSHTRVLQTASRELGRVIDWLIGNDLLGLSTVVLDWRGGTITLAGEAAVADGCQGIPVNGWKTVPVIEFGAAGSPVRAFLDTGAPLSYAHPRAVTGLSPVRMARDVHPLFGEFETEVYRLPIQVGARAMKAEFGVLPSRQRKLLTATNGWLLGSDFFRERRIILDYQNGRVIDCPPL
jgi:hypothetical protein